MAASGWAALNDCICCCVSRVGTAPCRYGCWYVGAYGFVVLAWAVPAQARPPAASATAAAPITPSRTARRWLAGKRVISGPFPRVTHDTGVAAARAGAP